MHFGCTLRETFPDSPARAGFVCPAAHKMINNNGRLLPCKRVACPGSPDCTAAPFVVPAHAKKKLDEQQKEQKVFCAPTQCSILVCFCHFLSTQKREQAQRREQLKLKKSLHNSQVEASKAKAALVLWKERAVAAEKQVTELVECLVCPKLRLACTHVYCNHKCLAIYSTTGINMATSRLSLSCAAT